MELSFNGRTTAFHAVNLGSTPGSSTKGEIMVEYYKDKCDFCGKKRHKIARLYWRKIGFTWKHLCKKCWDIQNNLGSVKCVK